MSMFEADTSPTRASRAPIAMSEIDHALTAQLVVAWAGESGDENRLGWWRSDLVSPYGGMDLFRRLLPSTWEWAVLQGAREAARRRDAEIRRQDHDPDRILSLFSLGFELDERIEERLQDLKRSGRAPQEALPELAEGMDPAWNRDRFLHWVRGHGEPEVMAAPVSEYLRAVRGGETIAVLDRDTPVAQIVPIHDRSTLRIRKPAPGTPPLHRVPLPKPAALDIDVVELLLEERQRHR